MTGWAKIEFLFNKVWPIWSKIWGPKIWDLLFSTQPKKGLRKQFWTFIWDFGALQSTGFLGRPPQILFDDPALISAIISYREVFRCRLSHLSLFILLHLILRVVGKKLFLWSCGRHKFSQNAQNRTTLTHIFMSLEWCFVFVYLFILLKGL